MRKQWIAVITIVAGLALGAAALVKFSPDTQRVEVGARAPEFRAVDLATGDSVSLRDRYRGHVTLVNIWATWCVPCRVEMPAMQSVYDSLRMRGFRIAAVSVDEGDPTEVRNFAAALGITFDILHDPSGHIQQVYQATGVPESFLLNRDGIIMKRVIGAHDWGSPVNRQLVERLLDAGS
ncbi:MAG TPA: TlpA disulfide reductase family protein [Gemmatimonadales bacterium]|nr:TlpA disulfide reductase family protein [Gemmatimonadales bacterium]